MYYAIQQQYRNDILFSLGKFWFFFSVHARVCGNVLEFSYIGDKRRDAVRARAY